MSIVGLVELLQLLVFWLLQGVLLGRLILFMENLWSGSCIFKIFSRTACPLQSSGDVNYIDNFEQFELYSTTATMLLTAVFRGKTLQADRKRGNADSRTVFQTILVYHGTFVKPKEVFSIFFL